MAAIRTANPVTVSFGGGLLGGLVAGIMGTVLLIGALQAGAPSDGITRDPGGAAVERALIEHRAGERASMLESVPGPGAEERALIEHRAGERASWGSETTPTQRVVNGR